MERLCFTFDLVAGSESEYDRMHREIWPDLADAILDAGYRNYSLFRRGTRVICVCECIPDVTAVRRAMVDRHQPLVDRWNVAMEPFISSMTDEHGNLIEYTLCWHLDEEGR